MLTGLPCDRSQAALPVVGGLCGESFPAALAQRRDESGDARSRKRIGFQGELAATSDRGSGVAATPDPLMRAVAIVRGSYTLSLGPIPDYLDLRTAPPAAVNRSSDSHPTRREYGKQLCDGRGLASRMHTLLRAIGGRESGRLPTPNPCLAVSLSALPTLQCHTDGHPAVNCEARPILPLSPRR